MKGSPSDSGADSGSTPATTDYTSINGVSTATEGTTCAVSAPYSGTPYTGDCDGCSFAFDVVAGEQTWTAGEELDCPMASGMLLGALYDRIAHFTGPIDGPIGGYFGDAYPYDTAYEWLSLGSSSSMTSDDFYPAFIDSDPDGYTTLIWDGNSFTAEGSWNEGYMAGVTATITGTLE